MTSKGKNLEQRSKRTNTPEAENPIHRDNLHNSIASP